MVLCFRHLISTDIEYVLLPLASLIWNWKNVVLIICLSVECEKFYSAIKDARCACNMLMRSRICSVPETRFCKNILRVQRAQFKKMSVYGLVCVDAALPLQLSSFITFHTIVCLQFAYL
ncbi:hypothetical protein HF086_006398 [Spodoptera exigua]|uniref:Uncharacterized protein n=1 Tax=Spodoptera exigua TaxID=7107 RepID=A0A922MXS4_SPOEX|nr:hypothetical protein HF086_006398 [Spodoptera exigua]